MDSERGSYEPLSRDYRVLKRVNEVWEMDLKSLLAIVYSFSTAGMIVILQLTRFVTIAEQVEEIHMKSVDKVFI